MLKRFAYHGLTVSDLDRSVAFYRDLMRMKLEATCEAAGESFEAATGFPKARAKVAFLNLKGDLLKLMQFLSPQGEQQSEVRVCDVGASHGSIRFENIDKLQQAYDALRAKGVKFISPPVQPRPERPDRMFTYMRDPDGILWEVHRGDPHHAHIVADHEASVAFYRDKLGMKLDMLLEIKGEGISKGAGLPNAFLKSAHLVLDTDEFLELHHYVNPEGKKGPQPRLSDVGSSHVAFDVDDVQQAYEKLRGKDVRFISPPVHPAGEKPGVTSVYMLDPESYVLELRSGGAPV